MPADLALCRRTLLLAAIAGLGPLQGWAETDDGLYRATAIVTGYDMRSRPGGFASCLKEVLVKLTGAPSLAADERLPAVLRHADEYVTRFTYVDPLAYRRPKDDQGTYDRSYELTVQFDRAKVDALVAQLGLALWRGERPTLLPVLRMVSTVPPWAGDSVLTADDPSRAPQRESLQNAATAYGLPLVFPSRAQAASLQSGAPDEAPGRMVVTGTLTFHEADFGWSGDWHTVWKGKAARAGVHGVSFDRAFDRIVRSAVQLAAGTGPFG